MEIALLDPNRELVEVLAWMLRFHGYEVVGAFHKVIPGAASTLQAVTVAIMRDSLLGTVPSPMQSIIAARGHRPTIVLTLSGSLESTAASVGVPAENCLTLPIAPRRLLGRLTTILAACIGY